MSERAERKTPRKLRANYSNIFGNSFTRIFRVLYDISASRQVTVPCEHSIAESGPGQRAKTVDALRKLVADGPARTPRRSGRISQQDLRTRRVPLKQRVIRRTQTRRSLNVKAH